MKQSRGSINRQRLEIRLGRLGPLIGSKLGLTSLKILLEKKFGFCLTRLQRHLFGLSMECLCRA
jgi:hypothetical protein